MMRISKIKCKSKNNKINNHYKMNKDKKKIKNKKLK